MIESTKKLVVNTLPTWWTKAMIGNYVAGRDEHSGILLYERHGSLEETEDISFTLEDIIFMDVGTPGFTEFSFKDPYVMKYLQENGYLERLGSTICLGQYHSHNTGSIFFSGEDMDDIMQRTGKHKSYLSIETNIFGEITGRFAYREEIEIKTSIKLTPAQKELKKALILFDLDIEPQFDAEIHDETFERLEHLLAEKIARKSISKPPVYQQSYNRGVNTNLIDDWNKGQ